MKLTMTLVECSSCLPVMQRKAIAEEIFRGKDFIWSGLSDLGLVDQEVGAMKCVLRDEVGFENIS